MNLEALVQRIMERRAEAIETACAEALTGGTCGVSVYDDRVGVDPDVPYGEIHYHKEAGPRE